MREAKQFCKLFGLPIAITIVLLVACILIVILPTLVDDYEWPGISCPAATTNTNTDTIAPVTERQTYLQNEIEKCSGPTDTNCCNGQRSVCDLRVDQVSFGTSHNTMSSREEDWMVPNNYWDLKKSLDRGVRGLMLDVHHNWPRNATLADKRRPTPVYLCHGYCSIGRRLFSEGLQDIKTFVDSHPRDLLVFLLEQYVGTYNVRKEIEEAGLAPVVNYQRSSTASTQTEQWPTVGELLNNGTRILIFSNRDENFLGHEHKGLKAAGAVFPSQITAANTAAIFPNYQTAGQAVKWHHQPVFAAETNYAYTNRSVAKQDCVLKGGLGATGNHQTVYQSSGTYPRALLILNHFISTPTANKQEAVLANEWADLGYRAKKCKAEYGHQVNFPTTDFWSFGETVSVAMYLNLNSTAQSQFDTQYPP